MYGFGNNKKVVLFDTLIKDESFTHDQIASVMFHEMGHWKLSHVPKMTFMEIIQTSILIWLFGLFTTDPKILTDFGFT